MRHPHAAAPALAALTCSAVCLLAACATPVAGTPEPTTGAAVPSPTVTRPADANVPFDVPSVTVLTPDEAIELAPWTACWTDGGWPGESGGCFDGMPADTLPHAGASDALVFSFPEGDWEWEASLTTPTRCGTRRIPAQVESAGDGLWRVLPAGPAGDWTAEIFGRGERGDAVVSIDWTTTEDGPIAGPTASVSFLADHDGVLDSYGTEIAVDGLASTPRAASAVLTVTAPDGSSVVSAPTLPEGWDTCSEWTQQGSLLLIADATGGASPLDPELGWSTGQEYTYTVELTLDGVSHTGTGSWPSGTADDTSLAVELTWQPALPGWDGHD